MVHLLDANVLIALGDRNHVHHTACGRWFRQSDSMTFATCPITQGALVRILLRTGKHPLGQILGILNGFINHPAHRFWADDIGYADVRWDGVLGHAQVTDAYLAALARKHRGRLATLDAGLAALHHDVAELIPTRTTAST